MESKIESPIIINNKAVINNNKLNYDVNLDNDITTKKPLTEIKKIDKPINRINAFNNNLDVVAFNNNKDFNNNNINLSYIENEIIKITNIISNKKNRFCMVYANTNNIVKTYMEVFNFKDYALAATNGFRLLKKENIKKLVQLYRQKNAILIDDKSIPQRLNDYLWSFLDDLSTKKTMVGLKATELIIKLNCLGGENINMHDKDNPMSVLKRIELTRNVDTGQTMVVATVGNKADNKTTNKKET